MKFLVLQHIDIEHPGIFRDFMREDGVVWDAVELDEGEAIPSLEGYDCLLYTSPSPRDGLLSRMPSSA